MKFFLNLAILTLIGFLAVQFCYLGFNNLATANADIQGEQVAFWKRDKQAQVTDATEQKEKQAVEAIIETEKGTMRAILYTEDAPITTQNFIKLAETGFYNGLQFHRVEPGFVIQTGDPTGTGAGGSEETIPLEVTSKLSHDAAGVLAMARTNDPNSASSQFYVTLNAARFLDGNYAVFGKVIEGVDVAKAIEKGDKMLKVTIHKPAPADPAQN